MYINQLNDVAFKLGYAINFWLSYQHSIERSEILEEKLLNLPICEFLHSKKNVKVEPEFLHPYLPPKRGDIKAIFSTPEVINSSKSSILYLENKWVRDITKTKSEKQRIFNDLLKLHLIKKEEPNTTCLFVIAGQKDYFNQFFLRNSPNENEHYSIGLPKSKYVPFYEEWFNQEPNGVMSFQILKSEKQEYLEIYKDCNDNYLGIKPELMPTEIKTKRIFLTKTNDDNLGDGVSFYSVGIWSIEL